MGNKIHALLIFGVIVFMNNHVFAAELLNYGFEDWGGDVEKTENYIFTTSAQGYADHHTGATEVVQSYESWLPHSGSYFFLGNGSETTQMNPAVPGISAGYGGISPRNNIGLDEDYLGGNNFSIERDITNGEIFIRLWARFNEGFYGRFTSTPYPGFKWFRIHNNDPSNEADIFWSIACESRSPVGYIWQTSSGGSHGSAVLPNAYDGNWHKFSMYVNFNTGIVRQWYDIENETADNAILTWNNGGPIGAARKATYVNLKGNYAGNKFPQDEIYYAIDDIEIWDGMPDNTNQRPEAPSNLHAK